MTELEGLRNKVKKYNKHKEEGKRRIKLDMEDRKKLYTTLQNCKHPLEIEQHITTKLVNIYTGREVSENVNVTEPVTFLCLIVGESNKMHQGENYQNFLKWWGGVVFRSFSYNNQMNLKGFFHKFAI